MAGGRDIIAIGASAGGIDAIREISAALPEDIPASVFIVLHLAQSVPSFQFFAWKAQPNVLVDSLQRCSRMPVCSAVDGQAIERGQIYVGVPNSHLLVERGMTRLQDSPKESWHKPSVDALFRSAALAYGRRVVALS